MTGLTVAESHDHASPVQPADVRPARLRASTDVRAVFAARSAVASPLVVVHWRDRADSGRPRVTVVAGRKVGGAVQRNRAKRRLRAIVATAGLRQGRDYVLVARPAVIGAPSAALHATVRRQLEDVNRR